MSYLRFKIPEMIPAPATVATFATVSEFSGGSVANIASVAGAGRNSDIQSVAAVASGPPVYGIWDAADLREMYEERAAIMEYDADMPAPRLKRQPGPMFFATYYGPRIDD
jgi:hypothetical protein